MKTLFKIASGSGLKVTGLSLAMLLLLASCAPEQKIGNAYVRSLAKTGFIVIPPTHLTKSNLSHDPESDSMAIAVSDFIRNIDDSVALAEYSSAFIEELRSYGFKVKDTTLPYPFMDTSGRTLVLDIAQIGVEEYLFKYSDTEVWDTVTYYRDFILRGVNLNVWIDLSGFDGARSQFQTLFNSQTVSDKVDGDFKMNMLSGEVTYKYTLYEMQDALVQRLPAESARKHASALVNYLINEEIKLKMPPDWNLPTMNVYLDKYTQKVRFGDSGEKFILME